MSVCMRKVSTVALLWVLAAPMVADAEWPSYNILAEAALPLAAIQYLLRPAGGRGVGRL